MLARAAIGLERVVPGAIRPVPVIAPAHMGVGKPPGAIVAPGRCVVVIVVVVHAAEAEPQAKTKDRGTRTVIIVAAMVVAAPTPVIAAVPVAIAVPVTTTVPVA